MLEYPVCLNTHSKSTNILFTFHLIHNYVHLDIYYGMHLAVHMAGMITLVLEEKQALTSYCPSSILPYSTLVHFVI